jgi:hypothetical protein
MTIKVAITMRRMTMKVDDNRRMTIKRRKRMTINKTTMKGRKRMTIKKRMTMKRRMTIKRRMTKYIYKSLMSH